MEIRELIVAGILRPQNFQSDNTIDSSKIAQARIAYGCRGQITDIQQPRYGQQVMGRAATVLAHDCLIRDRNPVSEDIVPK